MRIRTFVTAWVCLLMSLAPSVRSAPALKPAPRPAPTAKPAPSPAPAAKPAARPTAKPIVTPVAKPTATPPRLLGLCVGVDHSRSRGGITAYAGADAADLSTALRQQSQFKNPLYGETDVRALVESQATKKQIFQQFEDLLKKTRAGDTVIFFFSGTAGRIPNDQRFYFKIYNSSDSPGFELDDVLMWDAVAEKLGDFVRKKARVVAMIDGSRVSLGEPRFLAAAYEAFSLSGKVRVLASCATHEISYEKTGFRHGVFAHILIECLGGKRIEKWALSLKEVSTYLRTESSTFTRDQQHPFIHRDVNDDATRLLFQLHPRPEKYVAPLCRFITPQRDDTVIGDTILVKILVSDDTTVTCPTLLVDSALYDPRSKSPIEVPITVGRSSGYKSPIEVPITVGRSKDNPEPLPGLPPEHKVQELYRIRVPIARNARQIQLVARAVDTDGNKSEDTLTVQHKQVPLKGTLHLLAVGVKIYKVPQLKLRFADKDAIDLANLMAAQQGLLYAKVDKTLLVNGAATNEAIIDHLGRLARTAKQGDFIMVFLSGHGLEYRNAFYFVPFNYDGMNIPKSCVPGQTIVDILNGAKAQSLVLVDACHAGIPVTPKTSTGPGTGWIASCDGNQKSYENEFKEHGSFTAVVLDGLSGEADAKADGIVTIRDLTSYIDHNAGELPGLQVPDSSLSTVAKRDLCRVGVPGD